MNILLRELRANLKALIIWCISIFLLIALGMIKYSGIAAVGPSANELVNQMPAAIRGMLGMNNLDLTTISGFYGVFFLYFLLLAGTHAVMLGAVIIAKEERDKTADFIFVKPVKRSRIITGKLIAVLVNLAVLNLVTMAASIYFVALYNQGESINKQIVYLMISLFILQVIFAVVGAGISGLVKNSRKAASLAAGLFLGTFLLSTAVELYDKISFLKYFTPFQYFPVIEVMTGSFSSFYLGLAAFITVVCLALTYITFQKRDFYI